MRERLVENASSHVISRIPYYSQREHAILKIFLHYPLQVIGGIANKLSRYIVQRTALLVSLSK